MKTKHTPGPWYNHGADGLFDDRTHGPSIQDGKGNVICAVETVDGDAPDELNEERLANAHLIAAAPTLLETLKVCIAMLDPKRDADAIVIKAMQNAIAKATGGII